MVAEDVEVTKEVEQNVQPEVTEVMGMSVLDALKDVLKKALVFDGLRRGLHEVSKAIDSGAARLCCLARDCDHVEYTELVTNLCIERNVHLLMVNHKVELGQWAGLCKIGHDGEAAKIVACSSVVITDYGEQTQALNVLLEHVSKAGS